MMHAHHRLTQHHRPVRTRVDLFPERRTLHLWASGVPYRSGSVCTYVVRVNFVFI